MILEAIGDGAGVRARIDLEVVRDPILIENIVQFAGIDTQAVLVTNIHGLPRIGCEGFPFVLED